MAVRESTEASPENPEGTLTPLDDDKFEEVVRNMRDNSRTWFDNEITPQMERGWRYYNGEVDATSPPAGRSQVVISEVRDSVESVMVSLLRIFLSTEAPAKFLARAKSEIPNAQQRTDVANYVFMCQNDGFLLLNDAFRDGLVAKIGAIKVWWDEGDQTEESEHSGLDEAALTELVSDSQVEVLEQETVDKDGELLEGENDEDEDEDQDLPPAFSIPGEQFGPEDPNTGNRFFNVRIRRTLAQGRVVCEGVPSEEIIIDKRASCADDATLVGQDGFRQAQDVVNDGLADWDTVNGLGTQSGGITNPTEVRSARSDYQNQYEPSELTNTAEETDDATRLVRVSELYVRIDKDGDGIPELHRVIMLGDTLHDSEIWDKQPLCLGSPFRRPHTAIGFGLSDMLFDIQDVSTAISRAMLDSLYRAVNPQKLAVQNQVNMTDLLSNEFDGIIRTRQLDAVRHLETPFVGRDVLPILDWVEERKQERTGISKAALGLDADALQSSTAIGVNATITASQAKVESMARSFGEYLVGEAYKKISYLLSQHQDQPMTIKLRDDYVQVDPKAWTNDMDVEVMVGIGRGTQIEKASLLQEVIAKQEAIMSVMGVDGPIVDLPRHAQALGDFVQTGGIKDPTRYFRTPTETQAKMEEELAREQAKGPQPDPEQQEAQAKIALEQQKAEADQKLAQQKAQADLALKREEMQQKMQIEAFKVEQEIRLKLLELDMENELERLQIKQGQTGPGVGNIPSPTNGGG